MDPLTELKLARDVQRGIKNDVGRTRLNSKAFHSFWRKCQTLFQNIAKLFNSGKQSDKPIASRLAK